MAGTDTPLAPDFATNTSLSIIPGLSCEIAHKYIYKITSGKSCLYEYLKKYALTLSRKGNL
jgi:hypothetical protein